MAIPLWLAQLGLNIGGGYLQRIAERQYEDAVKAQENEIRDIYAQRLRAADQLGGAAQQSYRRFRSDVRRPTMQALQQTRTDTLGALDTASRTARTSYGGVQDRLRELTQGVMGGYDELGRLLTGGYADLERNIGGGYEAERDAILAELTGAGAQTKRDTSREFSNEAGRRHQETISRGLTGADIAQAIQAGVKAMELDALARIDEALAQQRAGVRSEFARERLGALERLGGERLRTGERIGTGRLGSLQELGGADIDIARELSRELTGIEGARADALRALGLVGAETAERLGTIKLGLRERGQTATTAARDQIMQELASFLERINHRPPTRNELQQAADQLGQMMIARAGRPRESSNPFSDIFGPTVGAASSVASAKILAAACIDANALIETPEGRLPLHEIQVGDLIIGLDGRIVRVTEKDCGEPWQEREDDFVRVYLVGGGHLVMTQDHILAGHPAKDWHAPERIMCLDGVREVEAVRACVAMRCGDLGTEKGRGYWANGFPVHSMINRMQREVRDADHILS
jgi:hypothetical protein